jgi:membrane-associated protease RseP (regulator of RpoE activity)
MTALLRGIAYIFLVLPSALVMTASQNLFGGSKAYFLWFFLLYVAVLWLAIFVHECGHAYAAYRFRWRITRFAVFPVAYRPKTRKLEFWTMPSGDLGGVVQVTDLGWATRSQTRIFAAAGPIANFLLAAVMLGVTYLLSGVQDLTGSIAVTSLFLGLGNLVPWRSRKGGKSDGATILSTFSR